MICMIIIVMKLILPNLWILVYSDDRFIEIEFDFIPQFHVSEIRQSVFPIIPIPVFI
jgi:hypothetical protein